MTLKVFAFFILACLGCNLFGTTTPDKSSVTDWEKGLVEAITTATAPVVQEIKEWSQRCKAHPETITKEQGRISTTLQAKYASVAAQADASYQKANPYPSSGIITGYAANADMVKIHEALKPCSEAVTQYTLNPKPCV